MVGTKATPASTHSLSITNNILQTQVEQLSKLTIKMDERIDELERNSVAAQKDCANARHVAVLFEEFVTSVTKENGAILQSHSSIKQQMETSEKMISLLAEKLVGLVSNSVGSLKELEETVGGQNIKITEMDHSGKSLAHQINQIKHQMKEDGSMASHGHGHGGGSPRGAPSSGSPRNNSHHSSGGGAAAKGGFEEFQKNEDLVGKKFEDLEKTIENMRGPVVDKMRENRMEIDSLWTEFRRHKEETRVHFLKFDDFLNSQPASVRWGDHSDQKEQNTHTHTNDGRSKTPPRHSLKNVAQRIRAQQSESPKGKTSTKLEALRRFSMMGQVGKKEKEKENEIEIEIEIEIEKEKILEKLSSDAILEEYKMKEQELSGFAQTDKPSRRSSLLEGNSDLATGDFNFFSV
ncbi:hypothetical protein ScalyP_jg7777 [Parmales sp. scaly parma]|nr:hypothetical protein ScalyP_jg7777 [Parmales sp. scaly parma]